MHHNILFWLRMCCLLTFIEEHRSYVLLAANVDDFHNIAKKIVPESLADKLASLASNVPVMHKSLADEIPDYNLSETEDDLDGSERDYVIETYPEEMELKSVAKAQAERNTKVNFEELVERVKDRLAKELKEELQNRNVKTQTGTREKYLDSYGTDKEKVYNSDRMKVDVEKYGYGNDDTFKFDKIDSRSVENKRYPIDRLKAKISQNEQENVDENFSQFERFDKPERLTQKNKLKQFEHQVAKKHYNYDTSGYKDEKHNIKESINVQSIEKNSDETINGQHKYFKNVQNKQLNLGVKKVSDSVRDKKYNEQDFDDENESQMYVDKHIGKKISKKKDKLTGKVTHDSNLHLKYTTDQLLPKNGDFYNKFDLISKGKNDSYEDYIIPNKENIFSSEETVNDKHRQKKHREKSEEVKDNKAKVMPFKNGWTSEHGNDKEFSEDYKELNDRSQEIKAETESLWFNDDSFKDNKAVSEVTASRGKGKGTGIPKRDFYKMISPNYYISLPTIAERFDFNEPLPERDREREVIKHFVNPPARINKKVRLT